MTTRADFLARIRDALGRRAEGTPIPPPPTDIDTARTVPRSATDLPARFATAAAAVGMTVHRSGAADLESCLAAILRAAGARRVALALTPGMHRLAAESAARAAGADILPPPSSPGFEPHYDADASITDVAGAIAETGSLVIASGPHAPRAAFLVPPVHIAIVREDQILPDLADFFPTLAPDTLPASLVLITGPSKTADIEGILITGAHGPREVHAVLTA